MSAKPPRAKPRASKPATGSALPLRGPRRALGCDRVWRWAARSDTAAAKVLEASIALIDRSSAVLAVAAPSPAEETRLLEAGAGVIVTELRVADAVSRASVRPRRALPAGMTARMVGTLLALEVERARSPNGPADEARASCPASRSRGHGPRRHHREGRRAGAKVEAGAGVVIARAMPHAAQAGSGATGSDGFAGALRGSAERTLAALGKGEGAQVSAIVPRRAEPAVLDRAAAAVQRELESSLAGFAGVRGAQPFRPRSSGPLTEPGARQPWPANVGEAEGRTPLSFETPAPYRCCCPP